jgi:hypothetical protein
MHFYHYKIEEVMDMKQKDFDTLSDCMKRIQARDSLRFVEATSYPYLTKSDMHKKHKDLYTKAMPDEGREIRTVTTADIAKLGFDGAARLNV